MEQELQKSKIRFLVIVAHRYCYLVLMPFFTAILNSARFAQNATKRHYMVALMLTVSTMGLMHLVSRLYPYVIREDTPPKKRQILLAIRAVFLSFAAAMVLSWYDLSFYSWDVRI